MKHDQKAGLALLLSLLLLSLVNASCTDKPAETDVTPEVSLWQCIDALVKSIPFTQEKLRAILNVPLAETRRDEYVILVRGHNALLSRGQRIGLVDFRLRRMYKSDPGFLVLDDVSGACTTLDEVRLHYPDLEITDSPRGRSLDEVTSYTSIQPWGRISFDFAERNRTCLSGVILAPKT